MIRKLKFGDSVQDIMSAIGERMYSFFFFLLTDEVICIGTGKYAMIWGTGTVPYG